MKKRKNFDKFNQNVKLIYSSSVKSSVMWCKGPK